MRGDDGGDGAQPQPGGGLGGGDVRGGVRVGDGVALLERLRRWSLAYKKRFGFFRFFLSR